MDSNGFQYGILSVIVFAALMSILYYLGIMQRVVQGVAWVVQRALGTSGPESLSVSANIFVGQTEAPLLIKPFLDRMTLSEIMAVMTGGFATVAGGVLAACVMIWTCQRRGMLVIASLLSLNLDPSWKSCSIIGSN